MAMANGSPGVSALLQRDLRRGAGLLGLSLALALAVNAFRSDPLPLRYQPPAERLSRVLAELGAGSTAPAQATLPETTLEEVRAISEGRKPGLLLDARPSLFYETGTIPGAENLSRETLRDDYPRLLPRLQAAQAASPSTPLVVFCSGSDCEDSVLVASALARLGHRSVTLFKGGWDAWEAAGYPTFVPEEKEPEQP